ncbi:hypothetical protein L9F63_010444 [Diploptera punctata]|nr:hypothetical protein L9F63_010444 [Diploptera punctata]
MVRIADLNLKDDKDGATPVERLVEKSKVHPNYDPTTFVNDIGIIRLNEDVPFSDLVRPICLPLDAELQKRNFERNYPYLAGWGSLEFNGPSSDRLMQLQIPVVSQERCKDALSRFKTARIDDNVLCAGYARGGKDACQGDSGGPLIFPRGDRAYLIGIVSYGYRCAEPGYPGVYTRVTKFTDWIQENLI